MGARRTYLFLNSAKFWGGGELWFLQCARALRDRGHDVTVGGRKDGVLLRRIEDSGVATLPLSLASDLSVRDRRIVRRWIGERAPVSVLCNFTRDVRIAAGAVRRFGADGPQIVWVMGSILLKDTARHRRLVTKHVDRIIVPSRALKDEVMAFGSAGDDQVTVLPNGLDLREWARPGDADVATARRTFGVDADDRVVGVFARLEPRKGQQVLLAAWPRVRGAVPGARLWVVGTGTAETELRALHRDLRCDGVEFVGFAEDVRERMLACDVVVQPSLYEPFGMTLLEAMACGKPVVCSNVGGMPEVVDEATTALVVAPDDPAALGEALAGLLNDPRRRAAMGRAGRQRVEERFGLDEMVDGLEELLAAPVRSASGP